MLERSACAAAFAVAVIVKHLKPRSANPAAKVAGAVYFDRGTCQQIPSGSVTEAAMRGEGCGPRLLTEQQP